MADAQTLSCPQCGAPADAGAAACSYCRSALQTVACPSCFGLMFRGARFCSRCGGRAASVLPRHEAAACPRCKKAMDAHSVGGFVLDQCAACGGLWLDDATFAKIREDRQTQAAFVGPGAPFAGEVQDPTARPLVYLPCPRCGDLMNRVNFAGTSGVILDSCRAHGTWFDKDELPAVIEFIRAGGLEEARRRELERLAEEKAKRDKEAPFSVTEVLGGQALRDRPDEPLDRTLAGQILRSLIS